MENSNQERKTFIDLALLVTIIPAVLYITAFGQQQIIFDYYHIPSDFITIDLNSVLNLGMTASIWSSFILSGAFAFSFIYEGILKKPGFKFVLFFSFCIGGLIVINYLMLSLLFTNLSHALILFIVTPICLALLILPFVTKRTTPDAEWERKKQTVAHKFTLLMMGDWSVFILTIAVLIPINVAINTAQEIKRKTDYLTLGKGSNLIILCKNDQFLFCRKYDEKKQRIVDSVEMIKFHDADRIQLGTTTKKIDFDNLK